MKKLLLILMILIYHSYAYTQDYDLIVKTNGDSIACHIDSITDTDIYFEMKINSVWIITHTSKSDIADFKRNVINKNEVIFKRGTSYIEKIKEPIPQPTSMFDIRKNSLILANDFLLSITLNYERFIPIHNRIGFVLRGGTGITGWSGEDLVFIGQVSLLYGKSKHFLETGAGSYHTFEYTPALISLIGYRYMGPKGFVFKAFVQFQYYTDDLLNEENKTYLGPGIVLGYRFWL